MEEWALARSTEGLSHSNRTKDMGTQAGNEASGGKCGGKSMQLSSADFKFL